MSDTPTELQNNEDTLRAIAEQNADLVAYIQEYQQQQADSQFMVFQLKRTIQKLQTKVSELENRVAEADQG